MTTTDKPIDPCSTPFGPQPQDALQELLDKLEPVDSETLPWHAAAGRILAQSVDSDRDSPPCDVSAMDGFALRLSDIGTDPIDIADEVMIGRESPLLPPGKALRIVTGGHVSPDVETIIIREHVDEHDGKITLSPEAVANAAQGRHIRRCGENVKVGDNLFQPGIQITPAVQATLTSLGAPKPTVHRQVRVGIMVTGDEIHAPEDTPEAWQIRDSNGPTLRALIDSVPWAQVVEHRRIKDSLSELESAFKDLLTCCDVTFMSGGVSMGGRDFVPTMVERCGGKRVFHRIPVRPGKPLLAAVGPDGQAIMGLPGNPVSVLTTARRFGVPVMAKRAGLADPLGRRTLVRVFESDGKTLPLWWYRQVKVDHDGRATLLNTQGSGDYVSAAYSDGFIEIPPGSDSQGAWPFYAWTP